jgi:putative iron-only hydrogenase system regulator
MENTAAMISIVVEDSGSVADLNSILHEYSSFIIGRMGLPYRERQISLISIALDGPAEVVKDLEEKIDSLHGVSAKAVFVASGGNGAEE